MDTYFETAAPPRRPSPAATLATALPTRVIAAGLCLAVAAIHVVDQGGIPGAKDPGYVAAGYFLLELAAVVATALLVRRSSRSGWLLSLGVALGPLAGYVLSRGPGLPVYADDRGNWTEPIGLLSLGVELALLLLAGAALASSSEAARL
ncbi:MAG: hypothetical protein QOI99_1078 [Actinomycetota bacterium]|jgi:hypothetical protein|nr:hypothetical protein [Actinomycetota bacterium]